MTPDQQEKIDRVALQLYEHILMPWLDINLIAEEQSELTGQEVTVPDDNKGPDVLPDMEEVTTIVSYLINDEEMDPDSEEFELATILKLGLFIYGYQHRNDPL